MNSPQEQLQAARALMQGQRPQEARIILRALVQADADNAEARRALAAALRQLGDPTEAQKELEAGVARAPGSAALRRDLGALQAAFGRTDEAIETLRTALALDPGLGAAAADLANLLTGQARALEALEVLAPLVGRPNAELGVLTAHALALKSLRRGDEAVAAYQRAARAYPRSGVAEHNLASTLGDLHRFDEAEAATRRAFALGLDAPETWLVHARALQGKGDTDAAAQAYGEALRRRPNYADAAGDLAQLIWLRTADVAQARDPLDAAIAAFPRDGGLYAALAKLLEFAGDLEGADRVASGAADACNDAALDAAASHLASFFDPARALTLAERAVARAPRDDTAQLALVQANLAAGRAARAAVLAEQFHERLPHNQLAVALLATAWRLMGDARYGALSDYEHLVGVSTIDTPDGWPTLEAYLADLAEALAPAHRFRTHPIGQSVRHGSQTQQDLTRSDDPAIKALAQALDGPIRRYIEALGRGDDPLRRRITGDYQFNGMWSVRLRSDGYHANHLHPMGWISSACYIAVPPAVDRGHEGWLQFGEPGLPTQPPLAADHIVQPKPGRLVLFPSYLWHGTLPFSGEEQRLSVAFDVLPA